MYMYNVYMCRCACVALLAYMFVKEEASLLGAMDVACTCK